MPDISDNTLMSGTHLRLLTSNTVTWDVTGPPLLIAWGRIKRSKDSEDQTSASAPNWFLWWSRRTKRPKRWSAFDLPVGYFFSHITFLFLQLLTFFFFARISQPLKHKEGDEFSSASPWSLFLLAPFKLGVDFSRRTAFLLLHCIASSMIFFLPRDFEPPFFLFSLSTVKQIWIIHFDERNCRKCMPGV